MTLSVRSSFFFVILAVLALVLAACAVPEKTGPLQTPGAATETSPGTRAPDSGDDLADLPPVAMLPPERSLRNGLPGPESPSPGRLIGLGAADIQKIFGPPDFKRHDPPAEIWQYRKDRCLLDVFLYQEKGGTGGYRVTHVEARGRSIIRISETDCLLEALTR